MLLGTASLMAQITVSGTVISASDDQPVPGVNVLVKGTSAGTVTDINGNYSIQVESGEAVLVFSMMGMLSEEKPVGNQTEINVNMVEDLIGLDEVVVVGYGTMKKSDITGAIISLKDEDLDQVKSTNVIENLQGKAAGVDITRTSGEAGSGFDIRIRGERSLSGNNDPLYIVDGIQYGSGIDINPSDIESIEILKDVSSTAIYGSKGANGVVIVTTKKGKEGTPKISFSAYWGFNKPLGKISYMDRDDYLQFKQDLARFNLYYESGEWPDEAEVFYEPFEERGIVNGTNTDWMDQITRTGNLKNYFLSVAGGKESITYNLSLDHTNEVGMLDQDDFKRYVLRGGMDVKVTDFLSVGTSNVLSYKNRSRMDFPERRVRLMNPLAVPYDSVGDLISNPTVSSTELTPLWYFQDDYYVNEELTSRIFSNVYANFRIFEGLNFLTTFNADISTERKGLSERAGENDVNTEMFIKPSRDITWSNVLTFEKTFGIHHLQITGVHELLKENNERYRIAGINPAIPNSRWYALDGMDEITVGLDPEDDDPEDEGYYYTEKSLLSYLGRVSYSLLSKYVFSASIRYDGSSILSVGNKWDYFPAASVAWNVSEESFMSSINAVSLLKLRAGYGVSGNYAVPPYSSVDKMNLSPLYYEFGSPEVVTYGYRPVYAGNPDLGWEKTASWNLGIDFGIFNNRISGNIDMYKANTTDLLQKRALPAHAAIPFIYDNIGETETRGIELMLHTVNISRSGEGFTWTTDLTFTRNSEKILELASGVEKDELNGWFVGEPIEVWYDYEKIGIWQFEDSVEMAKYSDNAFTFGDIRIQDQNNDSIINEADRVVVGTNRPDWYGSFSNRFEYKGFDLNIMIMARIGQTIRDDVMIQMQVRDDYAENGTQVDYWTPENPTNEAPRLDPTVSQISFYPYANTLRYTDGSWVKVRDITFGYSLPTALLEKVKISNLRFYVSAKNAFVLYSPFYDKGRYDPEKEGSTTWPIPRSFFFGLTLDF
jgi:TonB-linked SusC/RagA family outer membrane protein